MKKPGTLSRAVAALFACSPLLAARNACAEEPSSTQLEEIVVTAQKRTEKLLEVPLSISVLGAEQLQRQQVNTIQDLARVNPQINFTTGGEGSPGGGGVIRGIGTQAFSRSASGSVGIVVDGVPSGNVNINNLYDLARVEVLAGPQGTLFGDSVSAGLVNIVTNAPSTTGFSGRFTAEYVPDSQWVGQKTLRGVVNIPLTADTAMRVSAYGNETDGPTKNVVRNVKQDDRQRGARLRLLSHLTESLTANLTLDYNKQTQDEFFNVFTSPLVPGSQLYNAYQACGVTVGPDNLLKCGGDPSNAMVSNKGAALSLDWTLAGYTLTSITGYRKQDTATNLDVDLTPTGATTLQIFSGTETHPASFTTQEFRIASPAGGAFEYVSGVFFSRYNSHHKQPGTLSIFFAPAFPTFQSTDTEKSDYAAFGQGTYRFAEGWRAILGARFNHSTIDDTNVQQGTRHVSASFDNVSYKVGVQHDLTAGTMAYATITRGYKGPQANDIDVNKPPVVVRPEVPQDYEIGIKSALLGGRLALTADVFYTNIQGYQAQYCLPPDISNPTPVCAPANVDGVKTRGFDLMAFGNPVEGLTLNGGVTYAKATYPNPYFAADGTDLSGLQLANAPKLKANLGGEYSFAVAAKARMFVAVDGAYQSEIRTNTTASAVALSTSHTLFGGRIGIRAGGWTASLYGRNLTDERVPAAVGSGYTPIPMIIPNDLAPTVWTWYTPNSGRVIGISLDANF